MVEKAVLWNLQSDTNKTSTCDWNQPNTHARSTLDDRAEGMWAG